MEKDGQYEFVTIFWRGRVLTNYFLRSYEFILEGEREHVPMQGGREGEGKDLKQTSSWVQSPTWGGILQP